MIVGSTVPKSPNTFLCTLKTYCDFELSLEAKCDPAHNSGIQIRSQISDGTQTVVPQNKQRSDLPDRLTLPADKVYGYQVEIGKAKRGRTGGIYDEARRFIYLDEPGAKPGAKAAFREGEWNTYRIQCRGIRIKGWVNGVLCADASDNLDSCGVIGLQVHGDVSVTGRTRKGPFQRHEVRFRNIQIREFSKSQD